jgi:hypothetical protein
MTDKTSRHIPDLFIEKWLKGEASPDQAKLIEALSPEERQRLRDDYAARDAAFLMAHPYEGVRSKAAPAAWRSRWVVGSLALAASVILTVTVVMPRIGTDSGQDIILLKGGRHHLVLYRQTDKGFEVLPRNASARAGDRLQIKYVASGGRFGVVMSIDGRGTITPHLPLESQTAIRLESKGEIPLPTSYRLDDAPGFERFVLVTSSEPFATGVVRRALESLATRRDGADESLKLDSGVIKHVEVDSFVVRKVGKDGHD